MTRRRPAGSAGDAPPAMALEEQVFRITAAASAALEVAAEALRMAEERKADRLAGPDVRSLQIEGRTIERTHEGPFARRGVIGAYAFLSNLVVVENCVTSLLRLEGFSEPALGRARAALASIQSVVDRTLRNTVEHIDQRVIELDGLVVSTFVEGDLLCSSRRDGSVGAIAVTPQTLETVTRAFYGIFRPEPVVDQIVAAATAAR